MSSDLVNGKITSCRKCIYLEKINDEFVNRRFGRLIVVKLYDFKQYKSNNKHRWYCECECGNTTIVSGENLKSGTTQSCGCLRLEKCGGQQPLKKQDSFGYQYPYLIKFWSSKNVKSPFDYKPSSNKKVWWTCELKHKWFAMINNVIRGKWCPYCKNKKLLVGFNSLQDRYPNIAEIWHPVKNNITPNQIFPHINKRVWWLDRCGHEYIMSISNKTDNNYCCPYCSGKRVLEGFNDLQTTHPELVEEWDWEKNKIKPTEISKGTNKRVWWKCKECQHEWKTSICNRAGSKQSGCLKCNQSKGEKVINNFLNNLSIDFTPEKPFKTCKDKCCLPFDFWLPNFNLLIEYQGEQHYKPVRFGGISKKKAFQNLKKNQHHDQIKKDWSEQNNINLLIISYWDKKNIEEILKKNLSG
uniref:Treble clef zinc finger domain-containing protein n=1 Tax=viral metagenome TaxID=1070528 RepID=A0A6M3ILR1_9ZZZZ